MLNRWVPSHTETSRQRGCNAGELAGGHRRFGEEQEEEEEQAEEQEEGEERERSRRRRSREIEEENNTYNAKSQALRQ